MTYRRAPLRQRGLNGLLSVTSAFTMTGGDLTREKEEVFMAKRLVVVGGGAGGPSAAAKAKREAADLEVTILEAGEHVSFAA